MKLEMSHIVATVTLVIVVVAFIALMFRAMTLHAAPIPVSVKAKPSPDCRPRWATARRKPTGGEPVPAVVTDAACISARREHSPSHSLPSLPQVTTRLW